MREFLLGVLGAVLVYCAAWYRMAPEEATVAGPVVSKQGDPKRVGGVPRTRSAAAVVGAHPDPDSAGADSESSSESSHVEGVMPSQVEGVMPSRADGTSLAHRALPTALPKVIQQMSELQKAAADPNELAARVQASEISASELAELKAFAEKFVVLPPDRTEQRISGSSGHPEPASTR
jgi:hypothetical protein